MMDDNRLLKIDKLAAALAVMGTHRVEDVINLAKDRRAQIWDSDDTLVVTELLDLPLRKICRWWVVAGSVEGARALQPRIDKWALEQGATRADMIGRRGWRGVVDQEAWKHVGDYWKKDLV